MQFPAINLVAIILSTVVIMVLGMLWYSPTLFGKAWAKELGKKIEDMGKDSSSLIYLFTALGAIATSVVLAYLIGITATETIQGGLFISFMAWLGFAAPTTYMHTAFQGKSVKLFLIDTGYNLVCFLLAATIIVIL